MASPPVFPGARHDGQGDAKKSQDGGREQPPGVGAVIGEHDDDADRRQDADGEAPVVADDEVPPEAGERSEVPHADAGSTSSGLRSRRRRSHKTMAPVPPTVSASRTMIAASPRGQRTPAPSPAQNIPKVVSMAPTANFIVFSGTRLSGRWTNTPARSTTTAAAAAPSAASPTLCCAPPKVTTMNATSRPSSRTPLNETVNVYQSTPAESGAAARAACCSSRKIASSSWSVL